MRGSVKSASNISQQGCITQATKIASGATAVDVRCTSQATRATSNATFADEECTAQTSRLASDALMSTEVLELLEAMPHHELFIQEH